MKRMPQANMAQSKLTSSDGTLKTLGSSVAANDQPPTTQVMPLTTLESTTEPLTADFFRSLIGENTATITKKIDKVTGDLASLTKAVETSKSELAAVSSELGQQATEIVDHQSQLIALNDRITRLE